MKNFTRVRSIANLLRVAAFSMMLSGGCWFLPETWIDSFLVWGGMEHMPQAAVLRYVIRFAAYLQVAFGVLIWVVATDVVRYRPLVITILAIYLASAPILYWIDAIAGMPRWWCIMDFTCCILAGGVPLAFCMWPPGNRPVAEPLAGPNISSAGRLAIPKSQEGRLR